MEMPQFWFNIIFIFDPKRFPFEWNNPTGYLIAVIIEYITYAYAYFLIGCTLALGIGAFWFAIGVCKEIQCILQSINDTAQANENQSTELKRLFAEFIYIHGIAKQLSNISIFRYPMLTNTARQLKTFQSGTQLLRHSSTHTHVTVHVQSFCHFCCYADLSR